MSSTRDPTARLGGERDQAADFFETPAWCVHRLLDINVLPQGGHWLEPGAGRGAIIRAVYDYAAKQTRGFVQRGEPGYRPTWTAIDQYQPLRKTPRSDALSPWRAEGLANLLVRDYLDESVELPAPAFDVALGNPPYSKAMEFIKRTVPMCGVTAFLLRLNFIGTLKRFEFFRQWMPDLYVLPNRPSFISGATDSIEYAWFVWRREDLDRRVGSIALLDTTPAEERRA